MALKGKTPAEVAGIKVEGKDKWLTIMQKAKEKRFKMQSRKIEVEKLAASYYLQKWIKFEITPIEKFFIAARRV
jgi:hypothetical protein